MKYILLVLISSKLCNYCPIDMLSEKNRLRVKLKKEVVQETEKQLTLSCISQGGGCFKNRIHYSFGYVHNTKNLEKKEIRELCIRTIEIAASVFNSSERIKELEKISKYTNENFWITIKYNESFDKDNQQFLTCNITEKNIYYNKFDNGKMIELSHETIEEALQQVRSTKEIEGLANQDAL